MLVDDGKIEKMFIEPDVQGDPFEVSDAEIVPWTPAEIVARGFGDCKDKATLLVAMLRAAGFTVEGIGRAAEDGTA